jgi:GntR family transcriptional regulator, transcriptional repressor for pyruvate dehydrogenase complex
LTGPPFDARMRKARILRYYLCHRLLMLDTAFRKAPRDTLTDHVIAEIRRMVLTGVIRPGEMLPTQPQLAEQLGVGVATIRRAVAALSAVGLLDSQPGRGTTVNPDALALLRANALLGGPLDAGEIAMIYEARQTVETRLAELAALRRTNEDMSDIGESLDAMAAHMDDEELYTEADLHFHLAVARAGHNELLSQFYHVSRQLLTEVIEQLVSLPGMKEDQLSLQRQVYAAICAGDPAAAREATSAQLRHVERLMQRAGLVE